MFKSNLWIIYFVLSNRRLEQITGGVRFYPQGGLIRNTSWTSSVIIFGRKGNVLITEEKKTFEIIPNKK